MAKKKDLVVPSTEAEAVIGWLCDAWRTCRHEMTAERFCARWEDFFFDKLMLKDTDLTEKIDTWARRGHPVADAALRRYIKRMADLGQMNDTLRQVQGYLVYMADKAPAPYPKRGKPAVSFARKRVWIHVVLELGSLLTGLPPTRNNSMDDSPVSPSIAYYLSLALKRLTKEGADPLTEARINTIYWKREGLPGLIESSMLA
jgi:hypothetical protein